MSFADDFVPIILFRRQAARLESDPNHRLGRTVSSKRNETLATVERVAEVYRATRVGRINRRATR